MARGDRGVYLPPTGQARLVGHVRITRGENQLNGPAADVNLKTGIAQLIADPGAPVSGMLMPPSRPPPSRAQATSPAAIHPPAKGARP